MFIAAGLHTIGSYAKQESDKQLINKICPNGLISYGLGLERKKKFDKVKYRESMKQLIENSIKNIKNSTSWVLDSGGYQVSIGLLPRNQIDAYIESYHDFLIKHQDLYDEAFTLDMPISAKFFTEFETAYIANKTSYEKSISLPDSIRDRILFVSHFRTINNFELYNKLIYEDDMLKYFKRFSIGGLVVGQRNIHKLPINLYTIGFLQILLYFVHRNNKPSKIRFHILGASNLKSVLFFHLLKRASKYYYNIDVDLSYDSSTLFKKFQRARFFTYFDEHRGIASDVSAKEKDLDKIHPIFGKRNIDIITNEIQHMYKLIGQDISNIDTIYEGDTLHPDLRIPVTLLEAYQLKKFDEYCNSLSEELFNIYENEHEKFREELVNVLVRINKGKLTQSVKQIANTYVTSIDSIANYSCIDDLISFMYTYCNVTDSESMTQVPTWGL